MQKVITLVLFLFCSATVFGQITLTAAYFPVAGDTLNYGVAADGATVDVQAAGANTTWDFGSPVAVSFEREVYGQANDSVFTEADLILSVDSTTNFFYGVSETSFDVVGLRGSVDLFPGRVFDAVVSPSRPERRAPLVFGDDFSANTVNRVVIPRSDIPADVIAQLGVLGAGVDTVRITSTSDRTSAVDGYGTLTINGQTYQVLREKRVETIVTKIETRSRFLNYNDVTGAIRALFPDAEGIFAAEAPTTTYYFWSDTEKEAIATVTENEDGEQTRFSFIRADSTNSTRAPRLSQSQVKVYPNPARALATFTVTGINPGTYTLRLINVLGRQVSQRQFNPTGEMTEIDLDVSNLPWGTYLYSLTNERGRILTTRRLLVGR